MSSPRLSYPWTVPGGNTSRCSKGWHVQEKAAKVTNTGTYKRSSGEGSWEVQVLMSTAERRLCQESKDWTRLAGWVNMDWRHEIEDCLVGWRYQWHIHKGWGSSQSSWPCPQWFHLLCALCCSWVKWFSLPLPLCFCGSKPDKGRADYVIISFPGQVRSPSWSLKLGLSQDFSRPPTQKLWRTHRSQWWRRCCISAKQL